eukprot:5230848-Amphidinium_carterae.1
MEDGPLLNASNALGDTALHIASRRHNITAVRFYSGESHVPSLGVMQTFTQHMISVRLDNPHRHYFRIAVLDH